MSYFKKIDCLRHVFLEDTYVLGISESTGCIEFTADIVLTRKHPLYIPPKPNEQHCYLKAHLRFHHCTEIVWLRKTFRPTTDLNGEIDFGNFDMFEVSGEKFHMEGDWGELKLHCNDVSLEPL